MMLKVVLRKSLGARGVVGLTMEELRARMGDYDDDAHGIG